MSLTLNPSQYQAAIFDAFVSAAGSYRNGFCGENILRLKSEVLSRDFTEGKNNVILEIMPSLDDCEDGIDLVPRRAIGRYSDGLTPRWGHHVFFVAEGRVYDYDYAGLQGETFEDYMEAMWGNREYQGPIKVHPVSKMLNHTGIRMTTALEFNENLRKIGLPQPISNRIHLGEWDRLSLLPRDELMAFSMNHYLSILTHADAYSHDFV